MIPDKKQKENIKRDLERSKILHIFFLLLPLNFKFEMYKCVGGEPSSIERTMDFWNQKTCSGIRASYTQGLWPSPAG